MTPHTHTSERRKPGPAPRTDEQAPAGTINVRLRRIDRDRLDALMAADRAALVAAGLSPDLQTEADIMRRLIARAAADLTTSATSTASTGAAVVVATASTASTASTGATASTASTGATASTASTGATADDALREATAKWCEADGKGANNRLAKLIDCRPEQLSRWKSGTGALSPERRAALAGIVGGAAKRKARRA